MSKRTWVILGATSIIAEKFAHAIAMERNNLLLVARNPQQLAVIAADIQLRYRVHCDIMVVDFSTDIDLLLHLLNNQTTEIDLMIAHTVMYDNQQLETKTIQELIAVNVTSAVQLINAYLHKKQTKHHVLVLSSIAAIRGRAKNSLYGASKAALDVYLEGLQQSASKAQQITIARLGYIDTRLTYGKPGIFYAAPPQACAKACLRALKLKKRTIYYPYFWRFIAGVIQRLPWFIYKKIY